MALPLDVDRFLESLSGHYARFYTEQVRRLFTSVVFNDKPQRVNAREELAQNIADTMGVAELIGAWNVLREVAKIKNARGDVLRGDRELMLIFADQPLIPSVTFDEAVEELVTRAPVTIRNAAERTARRIAELYSKDRVMAFAYAAEEAVTERAQRFIVEALKSGIPEGEAGRRLAMAVDDVRKQSAQWTEAYSRMAFRTNVNTAVTAGRFRQVNDPDIKKVIPAFRYDAVGDGDTRHNHNELDGIILRVDNPEWNKIAPPNGYNCRCQVSLMTLPQLRRANRLYPDGSIIESKIPPGAGPDKGFRKGGSRPDLMMVGR